MDSCGNVTHETLTTWATVGWYWSEPNGGVAISHLVTTLHGLRNKAGEGAWSEVWIGLWRTLLDTPNSPYGETIPDRTPCIWLHNRPQSLGELVMEKAFSLPEKEGVKMLFLSKWSMVKLTLNGRVGNWKSILWRIELADNFRLWNATTQGFEPMHGNQVTVYMGKEGVLKPTFHEDRLRTKPQRGSWNCKQVIFWEWHGSNREPAGACPMKLVIRSSSNDLLETLQWIQNPLDRSKRNATESLTCSWSEWWTENLILLPAGRATKTSEDLLNRR